MTEKDRGENGTGVSERGRERENVFVKNKRVRRE